MVTLACALILAGQRAPDSHKRPLVRLQPPQPTILLSEQGLSRLAAGLIFWASNVGL